MQAAEFETLVKDYEHIIFDFGGIFININYQNMLKNLSELCGKDIDQNFFNQSIQDSLFSDFEMGLIDEHDFTLKVAQKLNVEHKHQEIVDAWNSILFDIPKERVEFLDKLKNKKLYLLSNINSIHASFIAQYLQSTDISFYNHFEKNYFSHEMKMRKPNKDIFEFVLKDMGVAPDEAFFIDDSFQHIEAARCIGISSYHLEKQNSFIIPFLNS